MDGLFNPYLIAFLALGPHLYAVAKPKIRRWEDTTYRDLQAMVAAEEYLQERREEMTDHFAWGIPNSAALRKIASFGPIIEICAGRGYWSFMLGQLGVDVLAFDPLRSGEVGSYRGDSQQRWTDVLVGSHEQLAIHPSRTLFLCWPPGWNSVAADCLRAYSGDVFLYVGGRPGDYNGDDDFDAMLWHDWRIEEIVNIPQWPLRAIEDKLYVYRRKA